MKARGILVGSGYSGNAIFGAAGDDGRDDIFVAWKRLRQALAERGLGLDTPDMLAREGLRPDFELHINARRGRPAAPAYVLLLETPHIRPRNGDRRALAHYRKVFTWRTDWIDGKRFLRIEFPNCIVLPDIDGLAGRERFACMIAGNKAMGHDDGRGLYGQRVATVRWFERHHPGGFDLWGPGWDRPAARVGLIGRMARAAEVWRLRGAPAFPSWRGRADSKLAVMRRTRFAICYENVADFPGYITEKIFDCLFAGCLPVYWGPREIAQTVPPECFIDRRAFGSHEALYAHLMAIDDAEYRRRQQAMREFLQSDAIQPYGVDWFAAQVAQSLAADLTEAAGPAPA